MNYIIAIDGPAGAGKSTIAKALVEMAQETKNRNDGMGKADQT